MSEVGFRYWITLEKSPEELIVDGFYNRGFSKRIDIDAGRCAKKINAERNIYAKEANNKNDREWIIWPYLTKIRITTQNFPCRLRAVDTFHWFLSYSEINHRWQARVSARNHQANQAEDGKILLKAGEIERKYNLWPNSLHCGLTFNKTGRSPIKELRYQHRRTSTYFQKEIAVYDIVWYSKIYTIIFAIPDFLILQNSLPSQKGPGSNDPVLQPNSSIH